MSASIATASTAPQAKFAPHVPSCSGRKSPFLATLKAYVEALGGSVEITATFGSRKLVLASDKGTAKVTAGTKFDGKDSPIQGA